MSVHYDRYEDRYWLQDEDGDIIWFDSVHEANEYAKKMEINAAVLAEREKIVKWLRKDRPFYDLNPLADELEEYLK